MEADIRRHATAAAGAAADASVGAACIAVTGAAAPAAPAMWFHCLPRVPSPARRYDLFNVRLRLAVFAGSTKRYSLVSLAHSSSAGSEAGGPPAEQQRQGGLYRGPALELLQPEGVLGGSGGKHSHPALQIVLQFGCLLCILSVLRLSLSSVWGNSVGIIHLLAANCPLLPTALCCQPPLQASHMCWLCWMSRGCQRGAPPC